MNWSQRICVKRRARATNGAQKQFLNARRKLSLPLTTARAALDGDESFDGVLSTLTAITASLQDSEQYLPALNPIIQISAGIILWVGRCQ